MNRKEKTRKRAARSGIVGRGMLDRQHVMPKRSMPLCPVCHEAINTAFEYAQERSQETKFKPVYYHTACLMVRKAQRKLSEAQV